MTCYSIRSAIRNGRSSSETIRRPSSELSRTSSETVRKPNASQATLDGSTVSTLDLCHTSNDISPVYPTYPPTSILKLRLSTQAEAPHLDVDEERSLWVAVTAFAEASLRVEDVHMVPLNIVVILDNSAYASSDSLKAASRAILDMAAELRHPKDCLAIICTSPAHPWKENRSGYTLRPLSPIDITGIQKDLRLAVHARPEILPQNLDMDQTLADAFYLLANGEDMEATGGEYCHVVLITSNPATYSNNVRAPVPVHIVQPAATPWRHLEPGIVGHFIAENGSTSTMKNGLKAMLLHSRARTKPGIVYDAQIELKSVNNRCKIMEIVGQRHFANLATGQSKSILCKVRITQEPGSSVTSSASKADALLQELETMLGVFDIELLQASITYRQSLFPRNTSLTATSICSIPLVNHTSIWQSRDNKASALTTGLQNNSELYKELILCVANSSTPAQALQRLQTLAPPTIHSGALLSFLSAVKSELSHQIKTITKHSIPSTQPVHTSTDDHHPEPTPTSPTMPSKRPATPLPPDPRPLSPVAESPDSGKTIIHKHHHHSTTEDNTSDAARKIWKDMKRDSRSTKDLLMMRSVTMGALGVKDGRLQEIQRQAVRNKRSIGADTLRSMSLGTGAGSGTASDEFQNQYAPWV